jgi:hypothetical protein
VTLGPLLRAIIGLEIPRCLELAPRDRGSIPSTPSPCPFIPLTATRSRVSSHFLGLSRWVAQDGTRVTSALRRQRQSSVRLCSLWKRACVSLACWSRLRIERTQPPLQSLVFSASSDPSVKITRHRIPSGRAFASACRLRSSFCFLLGIDLHTHASQFGPAVPLFVPKPTVSTLQCAHHLR